MKIINKQQEQRRTIHKAAELCAEYQDAWTNWLLGHTVEKAYTVIAKGERLLLAQNETGLRMQDPTAVRHRVLTCKQFLEDNPPDITKGRVMSEADAIKEAARRNTEALRKRR